MNVRKHDTYLTTIQMINMGECFKHIDYNGEEHFYIRSSMLDGEHINCLNLSTGILVDFKADTIVKPMEIEAVIKS